MKKKIIIGVIIVVILFVAVLCILKFTSKNSETEKEPEVENVEEEKSTSSRVVDAVAFQI